MLVHILVFPTFFRLINKNKKTRFHWVTDLENPSVASCMLRPRLLVSMLFRMAPPFMAPPEPLVVTNNMKKHCQLLFYRGVDAIFQQPPGPKRLHNLAKGTSAHSQHVHDLNLVVVVDVVQIGHPFLVSGEQRTISDNTPVVAAYCSVMD